MKMTDYKLVKILNDDVVILSSKYGVQVWSKITLRKDNICEVLGIPILQGSKAFRPSTNGYNRMHRISLIGMNGILKCKKMGN